MTKNVTEPPQVRAGMDPLLRMGLCALAVSLVLAIISSRCLYADGSHEFIRVLQAGGFVELMKVRAFGFDFFEWPLVVAIKAGVTNLAILRVAFGIGCFLPWPIALIICHKLAPEHFWIAVLACGAGYLNTAFMPVGEHIIAHAFFWPALFALLFARPLTPFAAFVLLIVSLLLTHVYESLFILGPPLAVLAFWRAGTGGERVWARVMLIASGGLLIIAALIALRGILKPEIPTNLDGFKHDLLYRLFTPGWTMTWTLVWVLLMVCVAGCPTLAEASLHRLALFPIAAILVVWGAWPIIAPSNLHPLVQHQARFMDVVVPLGLLPIAWIAARNPHWLAAAKPALIRLTSALLLAQSLWQIGTTWQWQGYVGIWRGLMASRTGPIYFQDAGLGVSAVDGQALRFDWYWSNPCMSIALSPQLEVQSIIMNRETPFWQPFDPLRPEQLPDLKRYGIDFSRYVTQLKRLEESKSRELTQQKNVF